MKRVAVLLGILALAVAPSVVSAQGFSDGSFLGFGPYFGLGGGTSSCGDEVTPRPPCVFYVGYTSDPANSTGFNAGTEGAAILNATEIAHHYSMRGVWLGLSGTMPLSERAGLVVSGWYFLPDNSIESWEVYNFGVAGRTWKTKSQWWYADILGAFGSLDGFSLLAGFRYDFFTTRFRDPFNAVGVFTLTSDTADVRSNGYIPLIGGQTALAGSYGSLLFRLVGFPYLVGHVDYDQTFGGTNRIETSGNYKGNYFIEAFMEYAYNLTGKADLGVFARFNTTHGITNQDVNGLQPGLGITQNATFKLGFTRNDWTVGGRMNLRF